jgi:hypothetical protein
MDILTGAQIAEIYRLRRDAADDMYAALEAFVDAWDNVDEPFQPQMPRLTKRAKEALAKARGDA